MTLDLLADEAGRRQDRRRGAARGEALADRRRARRARARSRRCITHPQVPGQCARFLRSELAHAQVLTASSTAEAVRVAVARGAARPGGARHAAGGGDLRRHGPARGRPGPRRQRDPLRLARRARGRGARRQRREPPLTAAAPAAGGRVEDIARLLGRRRRAPGLAGALPGRVRAARDQPHEDRVAAAARAPGQLHVLRGPAGRSRDEPAVAEAVDGLREICEEVRVLGSYRAGPGEAAARTGERPAATPAPARLRR